MPEHERPTSEKSIFLAAMEKPTPRERAAYLDEACGDNAPLRREVEELLTAHERLPIGAAATVDNALALDPPTFLTKPGTVVGRYKILEPIGEGGYGAVFMAEQTSPVHRKVALKIIKAGMDTRQVIARFEAERQALALMDHPNIARVFDAGTTDSGRPYFVMELVKGMPITKYCDAHHIEPRQRLELFMQVCQAVQHAHQKGIIHRDLKPNNVLVARYDGKPVPKVIDFGVAKATGQQLTDLTMFTGFGDVIGTLEYMSPEQAEVNQLDVDTRSDIYSLGVLMYELLAGSTPLENKRVRKAGLLEMLRVVREEEPPKPSTRLSTSEHLPSIAVNRGLEPKKLSALVHGELDSIVMKALEKDRARRYETANGLAVDVQRYLDDEAVQACPPSAAYRFRKFAKRNKGPVVAASLILLTLVAGMLGTTMGLIRAERARQAEAEQRQLALDAAAAEKTAKAAAEAREAESQAILDFVQNKVFAAAGPEGQHGGLGWDVTLRQAVEVAVPFVETSFPKQPIIEARLRTTLGLAFFNLGETGQAAEQFQKAGMLFSQSLGPDHRNTLECMNNLATCYYDLGRYADALKLREETLALQKVKLGLDHADTLMSMNNLAVSYAALGRYAAALKLREETLALRKVKLGLDHSQTLASMSDLAISYDDFGRHADALKLREETLELQKAKLGPDHPDTLKCMNNLAISYDDLGRYADALKLREETLELQKAKLGPDHPDTLLSMNNLGDSYAALGRDAEALTLFEETLALRKVKLGPDHPDTLTSMSQLAKSYFNLGRRAEALKLTEETLALRKVKLRPGHPDTLLSMMNLATSYYELGQYVDASKLYEETLALRKANLGPDHPETLTSMNYLADCYGKLGRRPEALKLHEETLALRKAKLGPDHPDTLLSMLGVAESLGCLDRAAEGLPIIDECLKRAGGRIVHPELIGSLIHFRLRHFQKTKDAAGCRATAEMWEKLQRTDAGGLHSAACWRAVTAAVIEDDPKTPAADASLLAREEADRAMAWLKQSVAAGYSNLQHMQQCADLQSLRNRDDFKKLIAELEAKSTAAESTTKQR